MATKEQIQIHDGVPTHVDYREFGVLNENYQAN